MNTGIVIWVVAPIVFGLLASGVYTWMNPNKAGTWKRYATLAAVYTAVFYAVTGIIYSIIG